MDKNQLDEMAASALKNTEGMARPILAAISYISSARTEIFAYENHSEASYRYMDSRMELARQALTEVMAHIVCIATQVPSHDYYRGGTPNHISDLKDRGEWN